MAGSAAAATAAQAAAEEEEEKEPFEFKTMNPNAELRPELLEKIQKWTLSFYHLDPRYKILTFFNQVASEGADNVTDDQNEGGSPFAVEAHTSQNSGMSSGNGGIDMRENYKVNAHLMNRQSAKGIRPATLSLLSSLFNATSILTVWRPCSNDAMRKMMEGNGVGKGLDIKGKSAKKGTLSAYVPFMQIFKNEQKKEIQHIAQKADMRIYYTSVELREHVYGVLEKYLKDGPPKKKKKKKTTLAAVAEDEKEEEDDSEAEGSKTTEEEEDEDEDDDPNHVPPHKDPNSPFYLTSKLKRLKKYVKSGYWGIECSQRLFWFATIEDADITRDGTGTETGRPSLPAFQDANMKTLKVAHSKLPKPSPMPVVVQYKSMEDIKKDQAAKKEEAKGENGGDDDALDLDGSLDPRYLVMAYEEHGTVKPVVSDFDGFLLGWRREALWFGCNLPRDQENLMTWSVDRIEEILDDQKANPTNSDSWTLRWLDVQKKAAAEGFLVETPEYGFGDPKSTSIMEHAALKLKSTGAVRHGSECFNFYSPQEIDDTFLLISDTLKPVPWKYVNVEDLQAILSKKISEGFVFPLNPKWILCDSGWKKIYDDLMASDALYADLSKDVWFPPYSGIRERIEEIHKRHPNGFERCTEPAIFNKPKVFTPHGRRQSATNILRETLDEGLGSELTGNAFADLAALEFDDFVGRTSAMPGRNSKIAKDILAARASLTIEELEDDYPSSEVLRGTSGKISHGSVSSMLTSSTGGGSGSNNKAEHRPSVTSHTSSIASNESATGTGNGNRRLVFSDQKPIAPSSTSKKPLFKRAVKAVQSTRRLLHKSPKERSSSLADIKDDIDDETSSARESSIRGSTTRGSSAKPRSEKILESDSNLEFHHGGFDSGELKSMNSKQKLLNSKAMNKEPRRHFGNWLGKKKDKKK